jgi:hypothetical protein
MGRAKFRQGESLERLRWYLMSRCLKECRFADLPTSPSPEQSLEQRVERGRLRLRCHWRAAALSPACLQAGSLHSLPNLPSIQ